MSANGNSYLPLRTERLSLRAPELHDAEPLAAVFADEQAMRFIGDGSIRDAVQIEHLQQSKIHMLAERGYTLYTVERRPDGEILGDCGLWVWPDTGETEIGWRFAPAHWGRGYATEAAQAVLAHARDLGLRRLICMVDSANTASWRIAERLGFRLDRAYDRGGRSVRRYIWNRPPGC
jgi:RimJ/RimL family protein N-acetyltransferase